MRNIRKLSFIVILGAVICALIMLGSSSLNALVAGKPDKPANPGKPDKPGKPGEEEATWAIQIPTSGNYVLYGDDSGYYEDGVQNIEVTVEKNKLGGPWGKDNDFVTHIRFKISNPTDRYVNFEEVSLGYLDPDEYDCVEPDIGYSCCVFPLESNPCPDYVSNYCAECSCMQEFMNGEFHPYIDTTDSTYRFFLIEIHAFDKDLFTMGTGESYHLGQEGHYHDYIKMILRYQTGDREPTYHNIDCSKSAHLGEQSKHPFNIWITRTGENTWAVDIVDQFLFLEENYYEQIRKNKVEWYSTLYQGGYFHFNFDLIRITPES
ncbi:MAG: hypothetical protein KAV87_37520 [Desulfobacteraceae bacterium]|nr:hypothetical protein [Desulfobacteraceae bacterium]